MTDPMDDLRQASADVSGIGLKNPLSPAAQAVLSAFGTHPIHADAIPDGLVLALAVALRAAVDQVAPHEKEPKASRIAWKQRLLTRAQLLAIAYELEHR